MAAARTIEPVDVLEDRGFGLSPGVPSVAPGQLSLDGSVALFESFRCSALDLRLRGFIEQVGNEFNFVVNAGFVICKMPLLDSSECCNSFQCVFGRA